MIPIYYKEIVIILCFYDGMISMFTSAIRTAKVFQDIKKTFFFIMLHSE